MCEMEGKTMKCWEPGAYATKLLRAILSMTTDSLLGRGVDTPKCFADNLRTYADLIEKDHNP